MAILILIVGPVVLIAFAWGIATVTRCWDQKRGRRHSDADNSAVDHSVIVTLIHGTWSPSARWTEPDSPLRRKLSGVLGDQVAFRCHRWSGGNSIRARRRATERLRADLESTTEQFPSAKHFIIGHSHGGSIAWMR
jgi:pimeloyl-ACP methyl ester carboxylesterase